MRRLIVLILAALMLLVAVSLVSAQADEWDLAWFTINGGGATSIGGDRFALSGTIGQPDAGKMSGGVYALQGGFWSGNAGPDVGDSTVYLPLILR